METTPVTLFTGIAPTSWSAYFDERIRQEGGAVAVVLNVLDASDDAIVSPSLRAAAVEVHLIDGGCISTDRRGQFFQALHHLAEHDLDRILVAASTVADPLGIAQVMGLSDEQGETLDERLHVDGLVTGVAGQPFMTDLLTKRTLADAGLRTESAPYQPLAERRAQQVEYADTLWLHDAETMESAARERIEELLGTMNPHAQLITDRYGPTRHDVGDFSFDAVAEAPGWLQLLREEQPEGRGREMETFVYRARRPFHPERLYTFWQFEWPGVIRSKGVFWLASRPQEMMLWQQAGKMRSYERAGHWWADVQEADWPEDARLRRDVDRAWDETVGDRRQEVAFIGLADALEKETLLEGLETCLMKDSELVAGPDAWRQDPFAGVSAEADEA